MAIGTKKVSELHANTLMDAFKLAMVWTGKLSTIGEFWFRGVNDESLDLEPGAYWRHSYDEYEPLLNFVQEGRAYADVGELSDWRTYYFAQHHGIPTRLTDWTESFSAALFFALDNWDGKTRPCVWIIRPQYVNQLSTGRSGIVTPEQNKELEAWLPKMIKEGARKIESSDGKCIYDSSLPLAIFPRKGNSRIIAQQGTFTVHGTEKIKLNRWILEQSGNPEEVICKIILKKWERDESLRQLKALGIKRHIVYPDISNYIRYLREVYKW